MSECIKIGVHTDDFDIAAEIERHRTTSTGAIVSFTGTVRDDSGTLTALELEHYPGMTENQLRKIAETATKRWALNGCTVIHRYGRLEPAENIVLVIVSSPHRQDAFDAASYLMDYLKTDAPFWKKEESDGKVAWVDAKSSDDAAKDKWANR